jgi:hypothetical protein
MSDYRKPGVYVEERLLVNSAGTSTASATALFVGPAASGPLDAPVLCNSWTDYVTTFGNFDDINTPVAGVIATSFLPYAVYSYFNNGGRPCYVQRVVGASSGTASFFEVTDGEEPAEIAFVVQARSAGTDGDRFSIKIVDIDGGSANKIFNFYVYKDDIEIERFQYLSAAGVESGTRKFIDAVNDPYSGSSYVKITSYDSTVIPAALVLTPLDGGVDPALPESGEYLVTSQAAVEKIEGPIILNHVGYKTNEITVEGDPTYTLPDTFPSESFGRGDVFVINDSIHPKLDSENRTAYIAYARGVLDDNAQDSYIASYGPWIIVPNPKVSNATITIPPGGAIAGTISRIDSTIGVFRAPAGIIANIPTAVGVDIKFTDTELGDWNAANINVIRPVSGAGIAIMGARTRKEYGVDRYISARRTLIYIKESLRRSTQFAMFENNDSRLWSQLIATAERLLRPLWEQGGLRGSSAAEAFYIKCDSTINTPAVISSGEVRMEIGVALEYPAEFIVIRVSQYESGGFTAEVQSRA